VLFALVSAVVFHVVLAQHQLELDHLNTQIAAEQRTFEEKRLVASELSAPARIVQEAQRLGLVMPATPPPYLIVPGAPEPPAESGTTATTSLADWAKAKPSLELRQP
jgi:hypothetical protein